MCEVTGAPKTGNVKFMDAIKRLLIEAEPAKEHEQHVWRRVR